MAEEQDNQKQESFDELYQEFQDKFSIDKLNEMTLETYTNDTDENGFTYWILYKFGTSHEQNYKGRERINFGIYKYRNKQELSAKIDNKDDEFAWKTKKFKISNNATAKEAFKKILEYICEVAENANEFALKDELSFLKKINNNPLPNQLKWKIAFLYSKKKLIGCYSQDKLIELLKNWLAKTPRTISDLQYQLVKIKNEKPDEFEEKFATLWSPKNKNNNNNNEDKTMKNSNESDLAKNLAELLKNTKNIILHGAPGTGKTYLAKDIAAYMNFGKPYSKLNDEEEKNFSEYTGFVQFHPSYDYTDFVEGIRPTPDGKFNLENGIFKKFCANAIKNFENPQKNTTDANSSYSYLLKALKDFVNELDNKIPKNKISSHLSKSMKFFKDKLKTFEFSTNNAYYVKDLFLLKTELNWFNEEFRKEIESDDELRTTSLIYKENPIIGNLKKELQDCINNLNLQNDLSTCWDLLIYEASKHDENNPLKIDNESYFEKSSGVLQRISKKQNQPKLDLGRVREIYEHKDKNRKYKQQCLSIINYMHKKYKLENHDAFQIADDAFNGSTEKTPEDSENINSFVFIIDEINRGELSKIFGELFFAIDPSYRGENGRVSTQYQNLIKDGDVFYNGFFVPDNVYIIGTMNDIDRSVESMDFAMRRRFTFKEITAKDSEEMLTEKNLKGVETKVVEQLKKRMSNLNDTIISNEIGLSSGYQIGAAYFLKFADYYDPKKENKDTAFQNLWDYNLEPLLQEYLRGQDPTGKKLGKLKAAYNKSEDNQTDQTNS